ncbi:MAG TPA: hypothetical protein GXX55_04605 [Firmicutes bacterium]|nr:hypothetical protein [Bacillota bacterium]
MRPIVSPDGATWNRTLIRVRARTPPSDASGSASRACCDYFCALLGSSPEAGAGCAASLLASVRTAAVSGKEVLDICLAGLVHVAVPLQVAGETVAVVLAGNVALRPLTEEAVAQLARKAGIEPSP